MEYLRTYEMLRKVGAFAVTEDYDNVEEVIVTDEFENEAEAAAEDILGGGSVDDDAYFDSILDTFAPYIGADMKEISEEIEGGDPESAPIVELGDEFEEEPDSSETKIVELGEELAESELSEEPAVTQEQLKEILERGQMDSIDESIEGAIGDEYAEPSEDSDIVELGDESEEQSEEQPDELEKQSEKLEESEEQSEKQPEEKPYEELEGNLLIKQMISDVDKANDESESDNIVGAYEEINDILNKFNNI